MRAGISAFGSAGAGPGPVAPLGVALPPAPTVPPVPAPADGELEPPRPGAPPLVVFALPPPATPAAPGVPAAGMFGVSPGSISPEHASSPRATHATPNAGACRSEPNINLESCSV